MANQVLTQLNQTAAAGGLAHVQGLITNFYSSQDFWETHGAVLTINWFVVAFLAILIKRKFKGAGSNFVHSLLMFLCNVSTLFVNVGGFYRLYPYLSSFSEWPILRQGHAVTGVVFSVFLVLEWFGGIASALGGDSSGHKKLGRPIAYLGMIAAIFGMLLAKEEMKAGIFAIMFLIEALVLQRVQPQPAKATLTTSSKTNKRD